MRQDPEFVEEKDAFGAIIQSYDFPELSIIAEIGAQMKPSV